jgi:hypothetical protein
MEANKIDKKEEKEESMLVKLDETTNFILHSIYDAVTAKQKVELASSAVINSSNPTVFLNSNYYYSMTIRGVGLSTTDIYVFIDVVAEQESTNVILPLDTTITGYKIKNLKIGRVAVSTTGNGAIGSSSVYIAFVAYDRASGNPEITY